MERSNKLSLSIEHLRSPRSPRRAPESPRSDTSTPFVSAPSSPRFYYYYSTPFSWEEKPGTPKRSGTTADTIFSFGNFPETAPAVEESSTSSVEYLSSMGFHFSAPVSPQRDFPSPRFVTMKDPWGLSRNNEDDEFEFTSARMSEADSIVSASMSHADELFFQGQLLPLKLPPRLQQQESNLRDNSVDSQRNRTCRSVQQVKSSWPSQNMLPRSPKSPKSSTNLAVLNARKEGRGHQRGHSHFFSSSSSSLDNTSQQKLLKAPPTRPKSGKKSLRELLHLGRPKEIQSRSSSTSSTTSSRMFSSSNPNSRSSSTSSTGRTPSSSSRQVNPVSSRELLHYGKVASKNVEELRRKTFMPYKQGLLGCLGCINVGSVFPGLREQEA